MTGSPLRVLLISDTHLGLDMPLRPRIERRRRGPDFFANFERALEPARRGHVDLVVHAGDLLFRSRVSPELVRLAFEPLVRVADHGVPVVVVPGNHERSRIPFPLLAAHQHLHIFDRPATVRLSLNGLDVAIAGFPCQRDDARDSFTSLLAATRWQRWPAPIRLLALHQTVEGARVGPAGYMFRSGPDVIRGRDLPSGFAAVLAGHIHRHQVLTRDLQGRPLAAPVLYPGAIERTSFAEKDEDKGYLILDIEADPERDGRLQRLRFVTLPTRPMVDLNLDVTDLDPAALTDQLANRLSRLDPDAIVRLRLDGTPMGASLAVLRAANLRALAPSSMDVAIHWPRRGFSTDGK